MKELITIIPAEPGLLQASPWDEDVLPVVAWRITSSLIDGTPCDEVTPIGLEATWDYEPGAVVLPDGRVRQLNNRSWPNLKAWRMDYLRDQVRRSKLTEMPTQEWIDRRCDGVTVADLERKKTPAVE